MRSHLQRKEVLILYCLPSQLGKGLFSVDFPPINTSTDELCAGIPVHLLVLIIFNACLRGTHIKSSQGSVVLRAGLLCAREAPCLGKSLQLSQLRHLQGAGLLFHQGMCG